uniref:Uncharacterized protein n=1 Tax=Tanacetum cinerariifolium TaxID=118510 RepID=A0A6L2JMI0_TANCI|nr:hypothetical protein [Tanacetum cinerariifolium]
MLALELMLSRSLKKNTKCFNAAGEELSVVKHKLMLVDTAAERRLMLLSQVKTSVFKGQKYVYLDTYQIVIESEEDSSKKLVPTSNIIHPDPEEEVKVPYTINGKICYLTDKEMQAYLDKEEKLRKAAEEERLLAISKPKVIKVVQEVAENIGLDPKKIASAKAGKKFKKAQDAEHKLALPALAPEQASYKSSRRKRKHIELEPEIKIPRLECNRALPENVLFVNNMVIEEPERGIFFTDKFGDQAFQRWSDIDKVEMEALVSYLVAASMVQSPENARFNMKLKKLIAEHPDQEKLKSKKVKLEALRYEMD